MGGVLDVVVSRREFLTTVSAMPFVRSTSPGAPQHPVLSTLEPVVSAARHVHLHRGKVREVAAFLAYEGLPMPDFRSPLLPAQDRDAMDFIFLTNTINHTTHWPHHLTVTTDY